MTVNEAEQHMDEEYSELIRALEDHINDAELYLLLDLSVLVVRDFGQCQKRQKIKTRITSDFLPTHVVDLVFPGIAL